MFSGCLICFMLSTGVCMICGYPMGQEYFGIWAILFVISTLISLHEAEDDRKAMEAIDKKAKQRTLDITKPKKKQ